MRRYPVLSHIHINFSFRNFTSFCKVTRALNRLQSNSILFTIVTLSHFPVIEWRCILQRLRSVKCDTVIQLWIMNSEASGGRLHGLSRHVCRGIKDNHDKFMMAGRWLAFWMATFRSHFWHSMALNAVWNWTYLATESKLVASDVVPAIFVSARYKQLNWRRRPSGMLRRVVSERFTDVSEVLRRDCRVCPLTLLLALYLSYYNPLPSFLSHPFHSLVNI
jgi:hypothetical protein